MKVGRAAVCDKVPLSKAPELGAVVPKLNLGMGISSVDRVGLEAGSAGFVVSRPLSIAGGLPKVKVGTGACDKDAALPLLLGPEVDVPKLNIGNDFSSAGFVGPETC